MRNGRVLAQGCRYYTGEMNLHCEEVALGEHMDLQQIREDIDTIDDELVRLFEKRMEMSAKVAEYKKKNNIPIYNPTREKEVLDKLAKKVRADRIEAITKIYNLLFLFSRNEQEKLIGQEET